jgi:hypothetical protein
MARIETLPQSAGTVSRGPRDAAAAGSSRRCRAAPSKEEVAMRIRTYGLILVLASLACATAQREIETPQQAVHGEGELLYLYDNARDQAFLAGSLLDMIFECHRAAGSILQIDGVDHFRIFGFDFVSDEAYALQGPRAFSPATQRAQTRAMGSATEFLFGVAATTTRLLSDGSSEALATSSVGAPNAADRERISSLSVSTQTTMQQIYETRSSGFLRGGRPSGAKFVSLGENHGYCVIVRYDIPLDQSANPGESPARAPAPPADVPPAGSQDGTGGYDQLPPGSAGDF